MRKIIAGLFLLILCSFPAVTQTLALSGKFTLVLVLWAQQSNTNTPPTTTILGVFNSEGECTQAASQVSPHPGFGIGYSTNELRMVLLCSPAT
jgi:hypothetical protein